jgi:hypothetical protein
MFNYGLRHSMDLFLTVQLVAEMFPASNGMATAQMLFRTAMAETLAGEFPDKHPEHSGVSVMQIDNIAFKDIKKRTRDDVKKRIAEELGINIDKVTYRKLAKDPLLAVLFARLHYMLVPEPFPLTLEEQAEYWKEHYNKSGKGTPEKFLERVRECEATLGRHPWLS